MAKRFWCEAARVDFDAIDLNLDDDHVGVREARWKTRIELGEPYGPHFRNIVDDRGSAAQGDVTLSGGVLKRESDGRCCPLLGDLA